MPMSVYCEPREDYINQEEETTTPQTMENEMNCSSKSSNHGIIDSLVALSNGFRMWNKCSMMDVLLKMDKEDSPPPPPSRTDKSLSPPSSNHDDDDSILLAHTSEMKAHAAKMPITSVIAAAIDKSAAINSSPISSGTNMATTKKNNFGLCRVCKDKATGIHYGIKTCEGCKGFFKRSLKKHEQYVCYFGNKCNMTPKLRKKCKLCRWKSCVEAGMSFGSMKMGRTPKRDLERAILDELNDEASMDANAISAAPDPKLFSIERMCARDKENLINFLTLRNLLNMCKTHPFKRDASQLVSSSFFSDAYMNTFNENILFVLSLLRDKSYQMFMELRRPFDPFYKRMMELRKQNLHREKPLGYNVNLDICWAFTQKMISDHVKCLVSYTRQLPGFNRLCAEDIGLIVKNNAFAIFGIKVQYLFVDGENYLMLNENTQMSRHLMTRLLGPMLVERLFDYHNRLGELGLTDYELSALCPFLLSMPGLQLIDPEMLNEIHEYYKRVLLYEFSIGNRDDKFLKKVNEVLDYIPENERLCQEINYIGHEALSKV